MHLFFIQGTLAAIIALLVFAVELKYGINKAFKYAIVTPVAVFIALALIAYLINDPSTSPGWQVLFFAVGIIMWLVGSIVGLLLGFIGRKLKNEQT